MATPERQLPLARVSALVAHTLGLHFPRSRWPQLARGIAGMARALDLDPARCAERLLARPPAAAERDMLAAHLTIGETYFFRDRVAFTALRRQVLPALIAARRDGSRVLRLWSAGCCTGEEAYSLAILVHELLPDLSDWQVRIIASDINPEFLARAEQATWGQWSFRDTPDAVRRRWFTRLADGRYRAADALRALVRFEAFNLVGPRALPASVGERSVDLLLCRNVLMYFTPEQQRNAAGRLQRALAADGWLLVAACEASPQRFPALATVDVDGALLLRHSPRIPHRRVASSVDPAPVVHPPCPAPPPAAAPVFTADDATVIAQARSLRERGDNEGALACVLGRFDVEHAPADAAALAARALADLGRHDEAQQWCTRWVGLARLDASAHLLLAGILAERGEHEAARTALARVLYLDPAHPLAHLLQARLAAADGDDAGARRHLAAARRLLASLPAEQPIADADGHSAAALLALVAALEQGGRR